MVTKIILVNATMLIMLCVAALSSELQEKDVEKRQPTLADLTKMIQQMEQRMKGMEIRTLQWLRGKDGRDGQPGKPGRDGRDGQPGKQGKDGHDGQPGKPGQDGKDGTHGKPGSQGPQGPPGKDGLKGPPGRNGGGVEYIRWGRTTCPSGADIVYKGRIGGEWYGHHGGGANYVCLPETPQYDQHKPSKVQNGGYMYGAEYQVHNLNPSSKNELLDHDAPCVACHVKTRSSKLMIPARYDCPAGWTREYHGYLMAEFHAHKNNKEFICVDQDAEVVSGTSANLNGATLHIVQGRCGSLPCRPYVESWELTCAVCTK